MPQRKLLAVDADGLQIISAHLQDAIVRVGDMRVTGLSAGFAAGAGQFSAVLNRFDWEGAPAETTDRSGLTRRLTGLRIDRIERARVKGINLKASEVLLNLLAIRFEETDAPRGTLTLDFAAGGTIALEVECIEAAMGDLGPEWRTRNRPGHGDGTGDGTENTEGRAAGPATSAGHDAEMG